jgi:hypothetical protein
VALAFCALITLFTIFFGSRHIATREKHEGLVFAIAFESVIKLIALGGVGLRCMACSTARNSWNCGCCKTRPPSPPCIRRCRKARGARCCWCSSPRRS